MDIGCMGTYNITPAGLGLSTNTTNLFTEGTLCSQSVEGIHGILVNLHSAYQVLEEEEKQVTQTLCKERGLTS